MAACYGAPAIRLLAVSTILLGPLTLTSAMPCPTNPEPAALHFKDYVYPSLVNAPDIIQVCLDPVLHSNNLTRVLFYDC